MQVMACVNLQNLSIERNPFWSVEFRQKDIQTGEIQKREFLKS